MNDRRVETMRTVCRTSIWLCTSVYVSISAAAFLLFGQLTASDVLENFDRDLGVPNSHVVDDIVRVGYAVHVILVFPLIHYALRRTVIEVFGFDFATFERHNLRFYALTVTLVATILFGATVIPNIWIAFQFTGVTAAVSIAFIFPSFLALS